MTEEEVLETISRVSKKLAQKFRFGYHTAEDLEQEAFIKAMEALPKYNPEKGNLAGFLWTDIHNHLFNLKRNKFERPDKPCLSCPLNAYDPQCVKSASQCTAYDDKQQCELYSKWYNRNKSKRNIMQPIDIGSVVDEKENNMRLDDDFFKNIDYKTIIELVDKKISIKLRADWIKFKTHVKLPKIKYNNLMSAIHIILNDEGINVS